MTQLPKRPVGRPPEISHLIDKPYPLKFNKGTIEQLRVRKTETGLTIAAQIREAVDLYLEQSAFRSLLLSADDIAEIESAKPPGVTTGIFVRSAALAEAKRASTARAAAKDRVSHMIKELESYLALEPDNAEIAQAIAVLRAVQPPKK